MTEEQVFLAVLELANPADRVAYLDKACGAGGEFRRQVEDLLAAHFKSGEFLDTPLGQQLEAGSETAVSQDSATADANSVSGGQADERGQPEVAGNYSFLQPSTHPDSLGRLGRYEVLQVLGEGGFGIVFRGFDEMLQRMVALKALAPALAEKLPARQRFLREARSAAQVRHDNVVHIYDVDEQPLPHLVMEFIRGETLQQRLDRTGPLTAPEIVRIGRQIAEGLAAAHATGLIHRDIKPSNVLIEAGAQERVKITDFGLARTADDASLTQSGVLAGTPMYMAPEQARGEALDHRADLFSLGSVLYALAVGRPPFRAATTYGVLKRVAEDDPRPIRDVIAETPPWLADVVAKLHAKRPDDRYQSARELADVLADFERQLQTNGEIKRVGRIPKYKRPLTRSGYWKWAAALLLPALVLATMEFTGITPWRQKPLVPLKTNDENLTQSKPPEELGICQEFTNSLGMKLKLIPAGKFMMGASQEEFDAVIRDNARLKPALEGERPVHEVELSQPFYMGVTEITIGQFRQFIEANPRYKFKNDRWIDQCVAPFDNWPMAYVSWQNAVDFCSWLSGKESKQYCLPTEAEWEYCCRAGQSGSPYCCGNDTAALDQYAWHFRNSGGRTNQVALKKPNDWGLFDMHGNVREWCLDWHSAKSYSTSPVKNPTGVAVGEYPVRVLRGGAWNCPTTICRSASRYWGMDAQSDTGFRVLLVIPAVGASQDRR